MEPMGNVPKQTKNDNTQTASDKRNFASGLLIPALDSKCNSCAIGLLQTSLHRLKSPNPKLPRPSNYSNLTVTDPFQRSADNIYS